MLFTPVQERTLAALCDCLIPPDDYPGAWDAGAGEYLVRLLNSDGSHLVDTYQLGLDSLEAEALARYSLPFAEASETQQIALLSAVELGEVVANWFVSPQSTFHLWVQHVMESYYSDSGNGGNRGNCSWEMVGFERQEATA